MRSPLVAGNWKMNKTTGEAIDLVEKQLARLTFVVVELEPQCTYPEP